MLRLIGNCCCLSRELPLSLRKGRNSLEGGNGDGDGGGTSYAGLMARKKVVDIGCDNAA